MGFCNSTVMPVMYRICVLHGLGLIRPHVVGPLTGINSKALQNDEIYNATSFVFSLS